MLKRSLKQLQLIRSYFSVQTLLYVLLVFLFLVPAVIHYDGEGDSRFSYSLTDIPDPPGYELNDTLQHYKDLLDSANKVVKNRRQLNEGKIYLLNNFILSTAYTQYYKPSPLGIKFPPEDSAQCYFITIYPYVMNEGIYISSTKTGNYLRYPIWDSVNNGQSGYGVFKRGHYAQRRVNIGFSDKNIMIPVSEKQYTIVEDSRIALYVLLIVPFLLVFLSMPLNILISISKGRAFEKNNVRNLKVIGWGCITIPAFSLVQQLLLRIVFYRYVPSGFHFQYFFFYTQFHGLLLIGVIVIIIAKAFEKGYQLQREQDLTI